MPFTIPCSKCQKTLQVPDEAAGKKVRCPACKEIVAVPAAPPDTAAEQAVSATPVAPAPAKKKSAPAAWDKDEEDDARPTKKKKKDEDNAFDVEDEDDDEDEEDRRRRKRRKRRRDYDDDDDDDDDYADRRPAQKPHRASTIMLLGIISIVLCCAPLIGWITGGYAISMANADLVQMSARRMDPSGRSSTQTGKMLGIVGCVMASIMAVLYLILRVSGGR